LLQAEAGGQAIDKIGPVVAVTNSAGGWRALLSALKAKSDHMKGIVAYETPGFVFPEGAGPESAPFSSSAKDCDPNWFLCPQ
jgi:hypothetical protein